MAYSLSCIHIVDITCRHSYESIQEGDLSSGFPLYTGPSHSFWTELSPLHAYFYSYDCVHKGSILQNSWKSYKLLRADQDTDQKREQVRRQFAAEVSLALGNRLPAE